MSAAVKSVKHTQFHVKHDDTPTDEAIRTKLSELKTKGKNTKAAAAGAQITAGRLDSHMQAISESSKRVLSELETCVKNIDDNE